MKTRPLINLILTTLLAVPMMWLSAAPSQAAGPRPTFQLPFPCGEYWHLATYRGHDDYDIDMTANSGTTNGRPILASYGGTVAFASDTQPDSGAGWYVKLNHGNGWQSLYLHMIERPMVRTGESVTIGQQIGRVGSTGDSSAPHLHYEQLADGNKTESWFNGVPSGITSDGDPTTGPLYISGTPSAPVDVTSNNCGVTQNAPAVAPVVYRGEFHVVGTASGGNVIDTWFNGVSTWLTSNLGGIVQGSPHAVVSNGQFHVVGANGGTVFHKWYDGVAWHDWTPIAQGSDPVAVAYNHNGTNELHVLSRAANGNVTDRWYDGSTWRTQTIANFP